MGTDHDDIVRRLRSFGDQPVDPGTAARHTSYLNAAAPLPVRSRRRPAMVGALLAGALLGGTGLAAALPGSLPEQAGSVAKQALAAVNLAKDEKVADKAARQAAKTAAQTAKANNSESNMKVGRFLAGCTAGTPPVAFSGTHGAYVKAHPDDPATPNVNERQVAAESDCGKPLSSLEGGSGSEADDAAEKANDAAEKAKEAAEKAKEDAEDQGQGKAEDTGRPESPGKSEENPATTPGTPQGPPSSVPAAAGDPGNAAENVPESVGPPST